MKKSISTFRPFDFKKIFIDTFAKQHIPKESVDEFFIHALKDTTVKLRLPLPPHRKTVNDCMFITKGMAERRLGVHSHSLRSCDFMLVPKLMVSATTQYSSDIEGYYFHFSDDFIASSSFFFEWQMDSSVINPIQISEEVGKRITQLLDIIATLHESSWPKYKNIIAQYLRTVLLEVYAEARSQSAISKVDKRKRLSAEYVKLVHVHFKKISHIADYAALLHVSPNHLNKTVKSCMGKTAQEIRNEILVQEAKVYLLQTDQDISEIAFELGFNDVSYFGRFFKKHTSMTPLEYRKMIEKYQ